MDSPPLHTALSCTTGLWGGGVGDHIGNVGSFVDDYDIDKRV